MADSDDEHGDRRKARDKFRRERNDYDRQEERRGTREGWDNERFRRSGGRTREVWQNRNHEHRENYRREYNSRRRERFSPQRPDMSPPGKRMRRDWDNGSGYQSYGDGPFGGGPMHGGPPPGWGPGPDMGGMPPQQGPFMGRDPDFPVQPPMMTFKQFLSQQDDTISESDAIKRYNDYKLDFRRQQINEFFMLHKEEEWFKAKYHPEECGRRREDQQAALNKRLAVFEDLFNSGRMEDIFVDVENADALVKLLDAAVIKMEGGTDFDLTVLDAPEVEKEPEPPRSRNNSESVSYDKSPEEKKKKKKEVKEEKESKTPDTPLEMTITPEQEELAKAAKSFVEHQKQQEETEAAIAALAATIEDKKGKKRKRKHDKTEYSYESGSESETGSDSEPEPGPPGVEDEPPMPLEAEDDGEIVEEKTRREHKKETELQHEPEKDVDTKADEAEEENKPRPLHKTCSIFLRNLAPTITQQEVEAVCKRFPGFMRVALQDPQPDRRFFRRGWVTFAHNANIKEICWTLNNIRLRDCELGATLNRDLMKRIRPVSGITAHRNVVRQDIQLGAKIVRNLDDRWHLWEDPEDEKQDEEKDDQFSLISRNPVLKNITDFLVEEGNFEEEELLGHSVEESKDGNPDVVIERDPVLLKALDRIILYLRIVHSIDFYTATEYPNEDEMPHRCGIMHARGPVPNSKVTQKDVSDWISNFENKTKQFVEVQEKLSEDEAVKLGKKDPEAEVEKFVQANTQELAKDKWLCPLSGKKFKGPDFVRKHIFNKHCEKIEEVRKEVAFFNNYLQDPKRPQLPEHPGNRQHGNVGGNFGYQGPPQQGMMGYNHPRPLMMFGGGGPGFSQNYGNREPFRGGEFRRGFNRPFRNNKFSSRRDPRSIIEYRDLDAPDDGDIF